MRQDKSSVSGASALGKRKPAATSTEIPARNNEDPSDLDDELPDREDDVDQPDLGHDSSYAGSDAVESDAHDDGSGACESDEDVDAFLHNDQGLDVLDESDDMDELSEGISSDEETIPSVRRRSEPVARKSARMPYNIPADVIPSSCKEFLDDINQRYPVAPDDPDVQKFDRDFKKLVADIEDWASSGTKEDRAAWFRKGPEMREMCRQYRSLLMRYRGKIADAILAGMPLKTRQVLGRAKTPQDLLDLPGDGESVIHRLTYLCVLTKFDPDQVQRAPHPDFNWYPRYIQFPGVKTLLPGVDPRTAKDFKVYVGSSLAQNGGRVRLRQHHFYGNVAPDQLAQYSSGTSQTTFYKSAVREGVIMNFRVLGVWKDPEVDPSEEETVSERHLRVHAHAAEGLLMTYLGLYLDGEHTQFHPECSFAFNRQLRLGKDWPNFQAYSLNHAWPPHQGLSGGIDDSIDRRRCANPECQLPTGRPGCGWRTNPNSDWDGWHVCQACGFFWDKHKRARTKLDMQSKRNPNRVCTNCQRQDPRGKWYFPPGEVKSDANVLCHACHAFKKRYGRPRTAIDARSRVKPTSCSICGRVPKPLPDGAVRWQWLKGSVRTEHNALCNACIKYWLRNGRHKGS